MKRELLEQPFSPEQIKQRAGNFGQTLDYIEGHAVIQRLNDAFDGRWSFQVKSHEILESEVIVLGELITESTVKSQFGSSTVTRAKNSGDIISLADDLKAASTDCLKKCATLFGVGLHLYSRDSATSKPVTQSSPPVIENDPFRPDPEGTLYCPETPGKMHVSGGSGGNGYGHGKNGGNGTSRLSQKQHSFLLHLADERDISRKELDDMSRERFNSVVSFLSKGDASSLIGELTAN